MRFDRTTLALATFDAALFVVIVLLLVSHVYSQTPPPPVLTLPKMSAYYQLPKDATYTYAWLQVDPPLTIARDAAGKAHLIYTPAPAAVRKLDVLLAFDGATGAWRIPDAYRPGTLEVYRNGLRQRPGSDYAVNAQSLAFVAAAEATAADLVVACYDLVAP